MQEDFYLHIRGVHRAEIPSLPPVIKNLGPYSTAELAMEAYGTESRSAEYEYRVWVDKKPDSK